MKHTRAVRCGPRQREDHVKHTKSGGDILSNYSRFAAMIATSTIIMFGLMYVTTYRWDHVFFSLTRFYMAFVMGASVPHNSEWVTSRRAI
ncbi:hypothetical protein [Deinococcus peraridilitoris]|uniref:hypothetical protein n=1 Tax=Deinococcus peraridilitoris TaxID=432329 RepID=UPI001C266632|nr:hypothetical protein [Deinococcus peraridilitoris]